jgi:hypothetical protein
MKTNLNKILTTASLALLFFSCKPELDVPKAERGSIDVTKYVAIGNSMSAGYADNALYRQAQLYSYPNLLAQQFKSIGGGTFNQPLVDAASVGIGAMQNARMILAPVTDCAGATSLAPTGVAQSGDFSIFTNIVGQQGPFNNMGVPGLKSVTAVYPGYGNPNNGIGNYNPFFTRMAGNPQTSSVLSDAAAQQPGFFTLALGQDDVLAYAISGGTQDAITPVAGPAGVGFKGSIDAIVSTLTAGGAKGLILNIPDLASLPFFTTVPYNGLMLDQANADALSAAYAPLGISFQAGANPFIIEDANAPGGIRKINQGEMVLLSVPQDSLKCAGWGSMKPIPDRFVLTSTEIAQINTAINGYNDALESVAGETNLAIFDINKLFNSAKTGIVYNGIAMNAQFVSGGIFSLDGINLTPRGNALLANEIISTINTKYGSTIPKVDVTRYPGVVFP